MLQNYWKIAVRNLLRHKGYAFINVFGLAVGIACCLLIGLYVRDELRYDRFHEQADRIYRVSVGDDQFVTPTIVAPLFKRTFPAVEDATRLYDVGAFRPTVIQRGNELFQEAGFMYADSTVFDVFTLPFVEGSPADALVRPNTLVLTASAASRFFGTANPVGQTLLVDGGNAFEVTGVIEDLPAQSHVDFAVLASFSTTNWASREIWDSANFYTYVLLREGQSGAAFARQVADYVDKVRDEVGLPEEYALKLQPLTDIHLYVEGAIRYVYVFGVLALLVLLVACVNYMNLATARSARRAREVGVRKVSGAGRGQLMAQFYGESALLTLLALLLGLGLAIGLVPTFNALSGKALSAAAFSHPFVWLSLLGIGVIVSVVAGSYPALLLSSFRPAQVLKGGAATSRGAGRLRKLLVVFQFAASIVLIVGTMVVYQQLDYVRTTDLGFDKERVVVLPIGDRQLRQDYPTLKAALEQQAGVQSVAAVNSYPGYQRGGYALEAEGLQMPEGEFFGIRGMQADEDVVATLGLTLIAGDGFPQSDSYTLEQGYVYLINETTVRRLGWTPEEAIGKRFNLLGNRQGEVVGVVKDFNHSSLHDTIDPLALFIEPSNYEYLLVRTAPGDVAGALRGIEQAWRQYVTHRPFEYQFLDQAFDALYRAEVQLGQVFGVFALLAILIACLGLFGLAAFAAEQRTKEIGVRKVLGATVAGIALLLSRDFARLVGVAFVLAVPVAYFAMNAWLSDFTYRTSLGVGTFLLAGVLTLLVAVLTVSYQSARAALVDPVKALRYE